MLDSLPQPAALVLVIVVGYAHSRAGSGNDHVVRVAASAAMPPS
jgi:hypothetical protein